MKGVTSINTKDNNSNINDNSETINKIAQVLNSPKTKTVTEIGTYIKVTREHKGLSSLQLAPRVGIPAYQLEAFEESRELPSGRELHQIVKALGLDPIVAKQALTNDINKKQITQKVEITQINIKILSNFFDEIYKEIDALKSTTINNEWDDFDHTEINYTIKGILITLFHMGVITKNPDDIEAELVTHEQCEYIIESIQHFTNQKN